MSGEAKRHDVQLLLAAGIPHERGGGMGATSVSNVVRMAENSLIRPKSALGPSCAARPPTLASRWRSLPRPQRGGGGVCVPKAALGAWTRRRRRGHLQRALSPAHNRAVQDKRERPWMPVLSSHALTGHSRACLRPLPDVFHVGGSVTTVFAPLGHTMTSTTNGSFFTAASSSSLMALT